MNQMDSSEQQQNDWIYYWQNECIKMYEWIKLVNIQ